MVRLYSLLCCLLLAGCATAPVDPIPEGPVYPAPFGCEDLRTRGGICLVELERVLAGLHRRFQYRSDQQVWGRLDHWESDSELPDQGQLVGDCDTFALAARKALRARGIPSRLMLCSIRQPGDHLVAEVDGYLLDNRSRWLRPWTDATCAPLAISGYRAGDAWRRIDEQSAGALLRQ